ncbi:hypothetical protein JL100_020905 [Skermanella mucosa]|uniref:hypothetical protein n=1 Tax=Skermanella mucosa TaxID=1789672 RepID=UPI00192BD1BD|nr:hypothetical protein [Skermanella mucosa]UEM19532.1 hypothetical protein JL100_020905 [Skermanella mucosa]
MRQLQRLLEDRDPEGHAAAILSLDRALTVDHPRPLPRTNLILIAGNGARRREDGEALIGWQKMPEEYKASHDLQVVELILTDGEVLIDGIYSTLWQEEA